MTKMAKNSQMLMAVVVGGLLILGGLWATGKLGTASVIGGGGDGQTIIVQNADTCPTTKLTSFTVDVQNSLNDTGQEGYDTTYYVRGGTSYTGTDSTSPTAVNVNCGKETQVEFVAADGSQGDNSRVARIYEGEGAVIEDGKVKFTPTSGAYALRVGIPQHGVLGFKAYDSDNAVYAVSQGNTTAYTSDGATFYDGVSKRAKTVGAGGSVHYVINARTNFSDVDFNDYYTLIAVEAPVTTWQTPSVKIDGVSASSVKGSLTTNEEKLLSGYEAIYKVDKPILDGNDGISVDIFMQALSGVNPSTDPEVDFLTAGRYLTLDGVTTAVGAARDDAASTAVFTVMDTTLNIE